MRIKVLFAILFAVLLLNSNHVSAQAESIHENSDKLVVILTSDDPYVAETVALMYTHAAKTNEWFKDVTLIVWGPSAKMVTENIKVQEKLKAMQEDGVVLEACIACANSYNVTDELKKLGIDVKGMGQPLTQYLKSGAKVLTF